MPFPRSITPIALLFPLAALLASSPAHGQTREEKVRNDRRRVEAEGFWIYNDLEKAYAEARRTGKPILVNLRCLPCEECVKLDDDLVEQDPVVRPLLEKYVCVRVVATNGLDLSLFQYDTDQSFAVFLLNAEKTVYGRFGTRSHRTEWVGDVSIEGMAKALQAGLELHAAYPANREQLAAKRGAPLEFPTPEQYPSLKGKYTDTLNYSGDVVKSCIHCHQIGDARRDYYRARREPIPESLLFPYPHPRVLGMVFDPREIATLRGVEPESLAARAGLQPGDQIKSLNGQPLISVADVQWVLHHLDGQGDRLTAEVVRDGEPRSLSLALPAGWKREGDISWRVATWGLRRMTTGGLVLKELAEEQRRNLGIAPESMALEVTHVGQFGAHAAAKQAGFQKGDVVVDFDGRADLLTEAELIFHAVNGRRVGERVPVVVLRNGVRRTLQLPMQP